MFDNPNRARAFWAEGYPGMQDVAGNLRDLRAAGFEPLGHFVLSSDCWLDYYDGLEARMLELADRYRGDEVARTVFESERRESDLYRACGESYGYVFYVARRGEAVRA